MANTYWACWENSGGTAASDSILGVAGVKGDSPIFADTKIGTVPYGAKVWPTPFHRMG